MRVLVCGGRDYTNSSKVWDTLDEIDAKTPIDLIIHGGAIGADELAWEWAEQSYVKCLTVPANWPKHGRAAGPIRNKEMLYYEPDLVVAFPGGIGTANMVQQALKAGKKVIKVLDDTEVNF